jgi:glutamate synthase (NADPH/NADH) large chain
LKSTLATNAPYGEWLTKHQISLDEIDAPALLTPSHASVVQLQKSFGYSEEDLRLIVRHMAQVGEEPIGSMGSDTALAVLSTFPRSLFDYFTQLFAQVTNPPLDAIREELVTSSRVTIGGEENLLTETERHCRQIVLPSPVLSVEELGKIRYVEESNRLDGFKTVVVDGLFEAHGLDTPGERLARAIDLVTNEVIHQVRDGANVVILSDRNTSVAQAAIPSLLLASAVHHHLVDERRTVTRLWSVGGLPLPRVRIDRRASRSGRTRRTKCLRGALSIRQGPQQGHCKNHVKNGCEHCGELRWLTTIRNRWYL